MLDVSMLSGPMSGMEALTASPQTGNTFNSDDIFLTLRIGIAILKKKPCTTIISKSDTTYKFGHSPPSRLSPFAPLNCLQCCFQFGSLSRNPVLIILNPFCVKLTVDFCAKDHCL